MAKGQDKKPPDPVVSQEDRDFEAEMMKRNPKRRITRFDFPPSVGEAVAVYMFEFTAKDELLAAEQADAAMTDNERKSPLRAIDRERTEGIRLSIVGLIAPDENAGTVTRRHIDQAQPLMDIDGWSTKAWAALRNFFGELNGIPTEELGNAVRGARRLGVATALPVVPLRAATGMRNGD